MGAWLGQVPLRTRPSLPSPFAKRQHKLGQAGSCPVPPGYSVTPDGRTPEMGVLACRQPDGIYNLYDLHTGAQVLTGVDEACVNQFGKVTRGSAGDGRCPAAGACALPSDQKFIMCPPSNGISLDYYLDALTGVYAPNMTTQSPDCKNQPNVIQVAANSPYCGGSIVQGPGSGPPTLVACFKSHGNTFEENIVDVYNGPDYALLASDVVVKDIQTRFPGQRYIIVSGQFCSALPDFGMAAAAPAPAQATTPTPLPTPISAPPTPSQAPTPEPVSGGAIPIPTQPLTAPQPMARQVPLRPAGPLAPSAQVCPPKVGDWWTRCLTKEQAYPIVVKEPPSTTLETALGIGSVAAAALIAALTLR